MENTEIFVERHKRIVEGRVTWEDLGHITSMKDPPPEVAEFVKTPSIDNAINIYLAARSKHVAEVNKLGSMLLAFKERVSYVLTVWQQGRKPDPDLVKSIERMQEKLTDQFHQVANPHDLEMPKDASIGRYDDGISVGAEADFPGSGG